MISIHAISKGQLTKVYFVFIFRISRFPAYSVCALCEYFNMQQHIHLDHHGITENGPAGRCNTVWRTWPRGPDIFPYMISHFDAPGAYNKAPTVVGDV